MGETLQWYKKITWGELNEADHWHVLECEHGHDKRQPPATSKDTW